LTTFVRKVVIIDDKFEEALPMIQSFSKIGVYSIYWDGDVDTKPVSPLEGVRLVVLDMRFSYATDSRTIVSHLFTLLSTAISEKNGPYILCVWSKHNNEYFEEFKSELLSQTRVPLPYLITNIEKNLFIERVSQKHEIFEEIASALEGETNIQVKEQVLQKLSNLGYETKETIIFKNDTIEKLQNHLDEKLKGMNSLSALIMWEELVSKSSNSLVNEISKLSERGDQWDNNIKTLIQHLAVANAGKTLELSAKSYILNAYSSMNYMMSDELWNQLIQLNVIESDFTFISDPTIKLSINNIEYSISKPGKYVVKKSGIDHKSFKTISELEAFEDKIICIELYNKYVNYLGHSNFKLLCESVFQRETKKPGSIYKVVEATLLNEISAVIFKSTVNPAANSLVKLDISSACDYAQNKLKRVRILFGVLVGIENFSFIYESDDIYCTPEIKVGDRIVKLVFNFHYIFNELKEDINVDDKLFGIRELLLTEIKHKLSSYISRVGIINL
jgi:hypothetical protein